MKAELRAALCCIAASLLASCSHPDSDAARVKSTTQASYDLKTGKLSEITYDQNKNGRIDTWTKMNGSIPVSSRLDTNEDGKLDRWEFYGPDGKLVRADWERPPVADPSNPGAQYTGRPNTTAYMRADGTIEKIEYFDSTGASSERDVLIREFYDASKTLTRVEEDSNADGLMDRFETYVNGVIHTVEFDEKKPYDGKPDRRMTYSAEGTLVLVETEPDGGGGYFKKLIPGHAK